MPIRWNSAHSAAALLILAPLAGCSDPRPSQRNVVLVTLDTTRADFLSSYGYDEGTTPHFDELARTGTRFELAIATASVTPVSHASILTGLDNKEHHLRVLSADGGFRLPADIPTLATVLREHGYETAAFHSAFPVSAHFGFKRGFEVFESLEAEIEAGEEGADLWDTGKYQRRSDETTNLVLAYLARAREPFFLWIHYWDPHDWKSLPPEEYLPEEMTEIVEGKQVPIWPNKPLYAAEVRYVDMEFGRVLSALREGGQDARTIITVVSDHGQGLGDHGWAGHRILYQEQIRVPLILRVPGAKQASNVADLVRTIDIYPTLLDYLGIEPPRPVSGRSLRGLIEGQSEPGRIAFADQLNGYDRNAQTRPLHDFLYCAMDEEWKLIYRPSLPQHGELYHLTEDPGELDNLYRKRLDQVVRLKRELARHGPWVTAPPPPLEDPGDLEASRVALEALGYLGGDEDTSSSPGPVWAWTCPEHADFESAELRSCDICSSPPILVRADADRGDQESGKGR